MNKFRDYMVTLNVCLFTIALVIAFFPGPKSEGVVTLPYPPVAGTAIKATEMKANLDTCINGINALESSLSLGNVYVSGATTTQSIATTTWTLPIVGATDNLSFASGSAVVYEALIVGKLTASGSAGTFRISGSLEAYDNTLKILGATMTKTDGNLSTLWGVSPSVSGNVLKFLASGTAGIQWRVAQFFYSSL